MKSGESLTKYDVLKKYFGHDSFREAQEQLIDSILGGQDCLGVMPTGAGKSVCFQVPAVLMEGTAVVISPLISLMRDQVEALVQNGIRAAFINSTISEKEIAETVRRAANGEFDILYAAPERLSTARFAELVKVMKIPLVAVDEAHCVSHWGQDFRPSYLKIAEFVRSIPRRPVVAAFTATATERVKDDIVEILELNDPTVITTGFDRPNLYFEVRTPEDKNEELVKILGEAVDGSVIVYCATRKNVESVTDFLRRNGFRVGEYHAGFSAERRTRAQEDFLFDRVDIMVATNAFGMGIDKSNVRLVVHYNCPKDIESYYQEAGRAGRDGSPARCILLYGDEDKTLSEFMIKHSHRESGLSDKELRGLMKRDVVRLNNMLEYCKTRRCLRGYILGYFGQKASDYCGYCGNCTNGDEISDVTIEAQKILSCIFRLKQRELALPREGVISVLLGDSEGSEVKGLSTYGIMRGEDKSRIEKIAEHLFLEDYFEERGEHKVCVLTPKADDFVRTKKSIVMRFYSEKERFAGSKPAKKDKAESELFKQLKALRKQIAADLGVPPYVVFSDASLNSMCVILPTNLDEFLTVSGVGNIKAERYGRKFLEVIGKYLKTRTN